MNDGWEGDSAGFGYVFTEDFGGEVSEKIGADFGRVLDSKGGGASGGSETNGIGGDFFPLKGHGGLG